MNTDKTRQLELDCPPFMARPDALLPCVLRGTGLATTESSTRTFGSWIYSFDHIEQEEWDKMLPLIASNIKGLYAEGRIRYGAWS